MTATETTAIAADAINALGIDLLRKSGPAEANALLSPYSIQSALAMTFAGAEGDTRSEMARTLHYPGDDAGLHRSFAALRRALEGAERAAALRAGHVIRWGNTNDPLTVTVANRLFGQSGYAFREPFLALVKRDYAAPLETLDFKKDPLKATKQINEWVEDQTRRRIRNLIPPGELDALTRLVLVNAIYLKAPWANEFSEAATKPQPFYVGGRAAVSVPTMMRRGRLCYSKQDGFSAIAVPYLGGQIHFLILLPDKVNGIKELESKVTANLLPEYANVATEEIVLYLPKFRLEPTVLRLSAALKDLGMRRAFDHPPGSANFDGIALRQAHEYLCIAEAFHKTFLNLDEKGTEAAAATAVVMVGRGMIKTSKPIEVRVDRPFLFAIQHQASGACLFLGRVTDPR